ncbi:CLIP domain-containing serine protease 14D isoform X2 [Nilaparvata lugens]|uniref:CLIP domain-containing serine protease 14D isoform X1 n=1 Tax=Nilaparvata lugens TaxID=108931 RepID=UPI00193D08C0|nr:CLIP domain-containing serine protease 14D isoform X1 [Nilaparvata lugens]XP_039282583.1 CLIP domain-containing serine protease 14D isoform X1 [Nilaparvata lugens]XP_039282584.1 CLIP domain-containing serine protease 14D isoform X1 [Nilaparvata lugens]XP_039282585.1 CLIP domain-containing serine protease 14D isoform X1 [Nilaparvata lugens]XP_039282586.1 CLIP domain-containing serine protease 14D isoform X2 [Nilaparvata lugens]
MKTLLCFIAVLSITGTQGQDDNPTSALNGFLVNDERCGTQPAIQPDPSYTPYPDKLQLVEKGEFPWLVWVSIQDPEPKTFDPLNGEDFTRCMGTIIARRYVLTASSCLANYAALGKNPEELSGAVVGAGFLDPTAPWSCKNGECPENIYLARSALTMDDFGAADKANNIALIVTAKDIVFNDYVLPICMLHDELLYSQKFWGERGVRVTGWGHKNEESRRHNRLMQAPAEIFTEEENKIFHRNHLPDSMRSKEVYYSFFGVGGNEDEVYTDEDIGGPFMIKKLIEYSDSPRYYLLGIRSFKAEESLPPHHSTFVYTRVGYHQKWILDHLSPVH